MFISQPNIVLYPDKFPSPCNFLSDRGSARSIGSSGARERNNVCTKSGTVLSPRSLRFGRSRMMVIRSSMYPSMYVFLLDTVTSNSFVFSILISSFKYSVSPNRCWLGDLVSLVFHVSSLIKMLAKSTIISDIREYSLGPDDILNADRDSRYAMESMIVMQSVASWILQWILLYTESRSCLDIRILIFGLSNLICWML